VDAAESASSMLPAPRLECPLLSRRSAYHAPAAHGRQPLQLRTLGFSRTLPSRMHSARPSLTRATSSGIRTCPSSSSTRPNWLWQAARPPVPGP